MTIKFALLVIMGGSAYIPPYVHDLVGTNLIVGPVQKVDISVDCICQSWRGWKSSMVG
jgi:hypothetical protein